MFVFCNKSASRKISDEGDINWSIRPLPRFTSDTSLKPAWATRLTLTHKFGGKRMRRFTKTYKYLPTRYAEEINQDWPSIKRDFPTIASYPIHYQE
jgi:hypothetical protein